VTLPHNGPSVAFTVLTLGVREAGHFAQPCTVAYTDSGRRIAPVDKSLALIDAVQDRCEGGVPARPVARPRAPCSILRPALKTFAWIPLTCVWIGPKAPLPPVYTV